MNTAVTLRFVLLWPLIALAFYVLTRVMHPLAGYALALFVYWIIIAGLMVWVQPSLRPLLPIRWPGPWVGGATVLMVAATALVAVPAVTAASPGPFILGAICLTALVNGTLEECFWRGTVQTSSATAWEMAATVVLFCGWHTAFFFATGVKVTGGVGALLLGALIAGVLWTLSRAKTDSLGFCIVTHVGLNLFAFSELASRNL